LLLFAPNSRVFDLSPDQDAIPGTLLKRLRTTATLDEADIQAIRALPVVIKQYRPDQPIVREGDRPSECCMLVEGFCIRAKLTSEGRRQILSIHIPGEIPDLQSLHLHVMDHDLVTLTECTLGFISHVALRDITRRRPGVAEALWRDTLVDAAIFREWIVNVGQRGGVNMLAHLVMELRERLRVIGRVSGPEFELPMTQEQLGEAMGITSIHANRILKQLQHAGVLKFQRGQVTILDEAKFQEAADFDELYLHLNPAL
jgi:CRP-like cAMP-binding protein